MERPTRYSLNLKFLQGLYQFWRKLLGVLVMAQPAKAAVAPSEELGFLGDGC